jgi:hypothetical protein
MLQCDFWCFMAVYYYEHQYFLQYWTKIPSFEHAVISTKI